MKNKGSMISIGVMLVLVVGLAIVAPLTYKVYFEGVEILQNMSGTTEEITNDTLGNFNEAMQGGLLDQAVIILFALLTISILAMAYVSDNALPFFVIYIFLGMIFILVSIPMSNIYQELMASPQFASIPTGAFTYTTALMSNLPVVFTVITLIVAVVLYGRVRSNKEAVY